ncbi:MAG: CsgG/HfaB family protein [Aquificaceae bacterium]
MKKIFGALFITSALVFAQDEGTYGKQVQERRLVLPNCSSPIGTLAARTFQCKAAQCNNQIGEGLADMLVTALVQTGCFRVVERAVMNEIREELELAGIRPQQTLRAADFIVTGAITALESRASGASGGGGVVIPTPFGIGLGVKGGKSNAHIGLDMRIINVRGGEIISSRAVEGKSDRWNFGIGGAGILGGIPVGGWFNQFKNTPMEEAVRDLIARAVALIVEDTKRYAPPGVSIGERIIYYDDRGNVIREQIR